MKKPIQVYIVKHKDFEEGEAFRDYLFKNLNKNPDSLNLKETSLPVYYRNDFLNINLENAEKTVIIIFVDLYLVEDSNFISGLKCFLDTNKENIHIIPIAFTKRFIELEPVSSKNCLRMLKDELESKLIELGFELEGTDFNEFEKEYLLNWVSHEVAKEIYAVGTEKKTLQIFLSHTKRDRIGRKQALILKDVIQRGTQSDVFFDENSIYIGSDFEEFIKKSIGNKESIVIIILSDYYSQSSWCRKEVLWAKEKNKSILTVNALEKEEIRSFPYVGNTRIIRVDKNKPRFSFFKVLTQTYLDTIRREYNKLYLLNIKFDGDKMNDLPELLTSLNCEKEKILYPDPPIPLEEMEVIKKIGKSVFTPMQLNLNRDKLIGKKMMFSISEPQDVDILPLKALVSDLIKYSIYYDLINLYGGFLKYKDEEYNLLRQMIDTLDFYKSQDLASSKSKIINYLVYPLIGLIDNESREKYGSNITIKKVNPLKLSPKEYQNYMSDLDVWSTSLTSMRDTIISEADFVVIGGGKLSGYKGKYPGVFEEFLISLEKKKAIYIIGGFGGVAEEIIKILKTGVSDKLTENYQVTHNSEEYKKYYHEKTKVKYPEILDSLKSKNVSDLNNGLNEDENEVLFKSEDSLEIINLILKGVSSL